MCAGNDLERRTRREEDWAEELKKDTIPVASQAIELYVYHSCISFPRID